MNKTEILTRDLCGLQLFQRQKDNYFDLGHLIQLYNLRTGENKRFTDFIKYQDSYMKTIYENEVCNSLNDNELSKLTNINLDNSLNDNELLQYEKCQLGKSDETTLSKTPWYKYCVKTKRGRYSDGSIWVHPHIFIEGCRYLSEQFKYHANQMVLDNLMDIRDKNGELRKALNAEIKAKWNPSDDTPYISVAMMMKRCIGDKNAGDVDVQQKEADKLKELCTLVRYGVIKNLQDMSYVIAH